MLNTSLRAAGVRLCFHPTLRNNSLRCSSTKSANDSDNDVSSSVETTGPITAPLQHFYDSYVEPLPPRPISQDENSTIKSQINNAISQNQTLPKFAIAKIGRRQYKFTEGDLVRVMDLRLTETVSKINRYSTGNWLAPEIGTIFELDNVLMVGSNDFTLLGRPLLDQNQVKVQCMVVEKTRSHAEVATPWTLGLSAADKARVYRRKATYLRILKIIVPEQEI